MDIYSEKLWVFGPDVVEMVSDFQLIGADARAKACHAARLAIEQAVRSEKPASPSSIDFLRFPEFQQPAGAFVTIYVHSNLRGCLGEIEAADPVIDVILRCARRTPLSDYRFQQLLPDELAYLT